MKPVTQDDVERELQQLLTIEPSSSFVARVRTAVANEPAPSRVSGMFLALAIFAVLLVAIPVYLAFPTADPTVASTPQRHASVETTPAPDVAATSPPAEVAPGRPIRPSGNRVQRVSREPWPEVLVSTDDQQAFERLVRGTKDGAVALSFEETNQKLTIAELTIAPITTEPLAILEQQGVVQ